MYRLLHSFTLSFFEVQVHMLLNDHHLNEEEAVIKVYKVLFTCPFFFFFTAVKKKRDILVFPKCYNFIFFLIN